MYDIRISGGTIVDGTGAAGVTGDVAIKDGAVVAMGAAVDAATEAATTIDATGRVVCPGFVDIHTHYDAQVMWDRMMTVSPWHGATPNPQLPITAVVTPCHGDTVIMRSHMTWAS